MKTILLRIRSTPKNLPVLGAALAAAALAGLYVAPPRARGDITFAPGQYDNTPNTVVAGPTPVNNQTTGSFRDVFWYSLNNGQPRVGSGDYINSGNSLVLKGISAAPGPGPITALNFTGPSVAGGQSYLTVFDTTPADGTATRSLFDATGTIQISADVLFINHNSSAGVVALYNEGQNGLALLANNSDGNNLDHTKLSLVWQSPGTGVTLSSITLPASTFVQSDWYRVTMDLTVSGDNWSATGTFQDHLIPTDPTSGLTAPVETMSFNGSLSNPGGGPSLVLTNPGEVGLIAVGNESISLPDNVGVSITDFNACVDCTGVGTPEPATLALLAVGALGLLLQRRRPTA